MNGTANRSSFDMITFGEYKTESDPPLFSADIVETYPEIIIKTGTAISIVKGKSRSRRKSPPNG
jgi:hypothetical protein